MTATTRFLLASVSIGVCFSVLIFFTMDGMWIKGGKRYTDIMKGQGRLQQYFYGSVNDFSINNSNNNTVTKQLQDTQQQLTKTQKQLQEAQKELQKVQKLQAEQQKQQAGQKMQKELTKQPVTTEVQQPHQQKQVRVLVWVLTQPINHLKKAVYVKNTWGKHADKLLFMSTADDQSLPTVNLHVKEGYFFLWGKTRAAFKYVYEKHLQDADWFMKSDDDTFVVMENLRYMLSLYDPDTPIFFGSKFNYSNKQEFMSGGGGYVLSRAALKLFVEKAFYNSTLCKQQPTGSDEDVQIAICLKNVGVLAGDSRDDLGRGRFFPFKPVEHLIPRYIKKQKWYWNNIYYPLKEGLDCCSDTAISFHYVDPDKMQELNYLLYHLRPHGIHSHDQDLPRLPPDHKSVPKELRLSNRTSSKKLIS